MNNSEGVRNKEKRKSPKQYDLYQDRSYTTLYDEVVTKQRSDFKEQQRKLTDLNWDGE